MEKIIDIIIINWNSGALTIKAGAPYLGYKSERISCNIIVVDNASTDNSLFLLNNKTDQLILNNKNLGFGKACNQAFKLCKGDYILLLNPDTESSTVVLEELVEFLEKNSDYAVTGPQQTNENLQIIRTCARFPDFITSSFDILGLSKIFPNVFTPAPIMIDWDHKESKDVDHVMGSYMLIKRPILNKIGFMDDDYFVYFEDLDLSKRIHNAGLKTFYNHQCSIIHTRGGTGDKATLKRLYYSMSARRIYWKKHLNLFSYILLTFLSLTIEPFLRLLDIIIKEKRIAIKTIATAYYLYFKTMINNSH